MQTVLEKLINVLVLQAVLFKCKKVGVFRRSSHGLKTYSQSYVQHF